MRLRLTALLGVLVLVLTSAAPVAASEKPSPPGAPWVWPVGAPISVTRAYLAPAHEYGPGHRGIDVRLTDDARIVSPAAGVIAFVGRVADRRLVTIDHGDGIVSTLEPVETDLPPGTAVHRGEEIGVASVGGHTSPGDVHLGVRLHGEYVNPLVLLGAVPRAVLLPCC